MNAICAEARSSDVLQGSHLCHGQLRIHRVDGAPHRGQQRRRRCRRTHDVAHGRNVGSHQGARDRRPARQDIGMYSCATDRHLGESAGRRVRDHADDGQPREVGPLARSRRRPIRRDTLADRILIRKEPLRQRLSMTTTGSRPIDVAAIEGRGRGSRGCPGLEVAAGDGAQERQRRNRPGRIGSSFHTHRVARAAAGERQARGRGRRLSRRAAPTAIENRLCAATASSSRGVVALGQSDAERQRRCRVEARIERAQLLEAADHEARRHEQHQRQRDLSAHQQLTGALAAAARRVAAAGLLQRGSDGRRAQRNRRRTQAPRAGSART